MAARRSFAGAPTTFEFEIAPAWWQTRGFLAGSAAGLALLLFGGVTTRHFVTILLMGILSGTYSSIFNAAPLLVVWEKREWRNWFRRRRPQPAGA